MVMIRLVNKVQYQGCTYMRACMQLNLLDVEAMPEKTLHNLLLNDRSTQQLTTS